ncbi:MAG: VOC family protein [Sphingomonadales bacterium]|nr:VOC family protein [Sphingomonadales bacterium]
MTVTKDHFILRADDLLTATRDFEALGFIVTQGSDAGEGYNALIIFPDDSYLEIVAYKPWFRLKVWGWLCRRGLVRRCGRGDRAFMARLWNNWVPRHREGWLDWCVKVSSAEAFAETARDKGLDVSDMIHSRRLADGVEVRWRIGGGIELDAPFFLEDVTPRTVRLPKRLDRRHPNGVTGVAAARFGVTDLAASVALHATLLGARPSNENREEAVFDLPGFTLTLEKATADDPTEGLREVTLTSPNVSSAETLDLTLSHGARIVVAPSESPDKRLRITIESPPSI